MKQLFLGCTLLMSSMMLTAQVRMPAPSPTQTIKQDFGLGHIEVKYSRPSAKGRQIFGDLVPYNKLWRTGANAATVVTFSEPVEINGKTIDTGSYALYTIPNVDYWQIILNKGYTNSGISGYKESDDVVRFQVQPKRAGDKHELFTIQFDNIKPESCDLVMMWEKTSVAVPIKANIRTKIKEKLDAAMLTDKKPYWQAAQFYNEYENNSAKALENITQALVQNPTAYWMWLYKARIQKEAGDVAGAKESATKSLELATSDKNDDYIKMNNELLKKLK